MQQNDFRKVAFGLVTLVLAAVVLAACGDEAIDRRAEVEKAVAFSGVTVKPTINPTIIAKEAFGINIVIFGIKDYYPELKGESVGLKLVNERETSIYTSKLCNTMLQRRLGKPEEDRWEDISYGRPCPPGDSQVYQLFPHTAVDAAFEFDKAVPFQGKSWLVAGTYRLLFIYYMRCPNAYNTVSYCEDRQLAQSNYFEIKLFDQPGATPTPGPPK